MREVLAEIRDVNVKFGRRFVLRDFECTLPQTGKVCVLGERGSGKSTAMHLICGRLDRAAGADVSGFVGFVHADTTVTAVFQERPRTDLCIQEWILRRHGMNSGALRAWLHNRALTDLVPTLRTSMHQLSEGEQRLWALVDALLVEPEILCVDQILDGLDVAERRQVRELLDREAKLRCVFFTTDDVAEASTADYWYLLASGHTVAQGQRRWLLESVHVQTFVKQGFIPAFTHAIDDQEASWRGSRGHGPAGFRWLWPTRLGGTAQPGLIADIEYDAAALAHAGVTHLVTLTEAEHPQQDVLNAWGLQTHHFPIDDMHAPQVAQAYAICQEIDAWLAGDARVVFHCRGGRGRTGTMLATYLIFQGATAEQALRQVREVEASWIESAEQEQFLVRFEHGCRQQFDAGERSVALALKH